MAINLDDRYPGRANGKTLSYPQGSFKNRTSPTSKDGTYLEQDWANDQLAFFQSLMKDAVMTANGAVDAVGASQYFDALRTIMRGGLYNTANATGTADAITASFTPAIIALTNGMTLLVRAAAANSTATPTFQADGTAAKTIVKGSNEALLAGDIKGAGHWLELQFDATLDKWVLQNPAVGIGVGRLFSGNGWQKLSSGLIIQWGIIDNSATNPRTITLPIAFPSAGFVAVASDLSSSFSPVLAVCVASARFVSNSQIQVATTTGGSGSTFAFDSAQWFAIGH